MPPLAFASSIANWMPRCSCVPTTAPGPVSGRMAPKRIGSAARPGPSDSAAASMAPARRIPQRMARFPRSSSFGLAGEARAPARGGSTRRLFLDAEPAHEAVADQRGIALGRLARLFGIDASADYPGTVLGQRACNLFLEIALIRRPVALRKPRAA